MFCALIYINCKLNLERYLTSQRNISRKKSFLCSYCLYGRSDFRFYLMLDSVHDWFMAGFLGKTLGAEELWRVLLNVNWCVNGHCDLWRSPPWESGEVFTDLVLCPLFFPSSAFKKSFHSRNACDTVIDRIKVENLILWDSSGPLSLNRHDTRSWHSKNTA